METEVIAIIGAGKGGTAILATLLKMPSVRTKHVCDVNPSAPGIALARQHGIQCHTQLAEICRDKEVDLSGKRTVKRIVFFVSSEDGSKTARLVYSAYSPCQQTYFRFILCQTA